MKPQRFEFAPIKYIHDPVLEEALNVGVAMFFPAEGEFIVAIEEVFHRLSQAFPGFNGLGYRRSVRELHGVAAGLTESIKRSRHATGDLFGGIRGLENLSDALAAALPDAGLTLRIGRIGVGVTLDPKAEVDGLFGRFVRANLTLAADVKRSDAQVWTEFKKKVEPRAFEWLRPKQVRTREVDLTFEHAFVNGKIHAVQPVSFDLRQKASIASKAARWVGFGVSLHGSGEMSKVYFVLGAPSDSSSRGAYNRAKDLLHKMPLDHELIEEDEAKDFEQELLSAREKYWQDES